MGEAVSRAGNSELAADYFHQVLKEVEPELAKQNADDSVPYLAADSYSGLGDLERARLANPAEMQRLKKLDGRRLAFCISRVCKLGGASIIPSPWHPPAPTPGIRQKSRRNCNCAKPLWQSSARSLSKRLWACVGFFSQSSVLDSRSYLLPELDCLSDAFHLIDYDQRGVGCSAHRAT
jgi:hypothetical protein